MVTLSSSTATTRLVLLSFSVLPIRGSKRMKARLLRLRLPLRLLLSAPEPTEEPPLLLELADTEEDEEDFG